MKFGKYCKIIWIGLTCLAVLASCTHMDSNIVRVHAEDATEPTTETPEDDDGWGGYLSLLTAAVGKLASVPTTVNTVAFAVQFAIAECQPIATAGDVSVYDGVASLMCDYRYDDQSYHIAHIGGNRRTVFSDAIYQYNIITYPSGSSAYYAFTDNGSVFIDIQNSDLKCIASGATQGGYTDPSALVLSGNNLPFQILYGGGSPNTAVRLYTNNNWNTGRLASCFGGVFGYDELADFNDKFSSDNNYFMLPQATDITDANEYLSMVYQKYEEEYGEEFEYSFPDSVPDGTLLPDGTIKGDEEEATDESGNIIVNVEFPTHLVPDVPEPETFPLDTVPEITGHETGEIPDGAFLGFDFWWNSAIALISLFDVWDLVMLCLWVGLICFLLWR